ncbi:unnamed protein product [Cyprideis torosa]|uniref:Uncharacterized protein n=1 Tax=Cyprideis torosa TaxID=163714 RepID=A0A7R8W5S2_9CRUS|nr:unnamed protein product [Cyprideis torosa]CAG0884641.1 unnamed protein product [Cyprideis torosa]
MAYRVARASRTKLHLKSECSPNPFFRFPSDVRSGQGDPSRPDNPPAVSSRLVCASLEHLPQGTVTAPYLSDRQSYYLSPLSSRDFQHAAPSESSRETSIDADPSLATTHPHVMAYTSGNPFVESTEGLLHLYKENQPTSLSPEASSSRPPLLCILAVPSTLASHDLLNFIAPCFPGIQHVRIIRNEKPNQYMVLLKFKSQRLADEFFKTYNGIPFTSFSPEICHLVYISKLETVKQSEGGCLPLEGHTELPTCPVCLERMDESVDGILTILCNHSFHGNCLYKWGDSSCPVCRYTSTPEIQEDHECFVCASKEQDELWICLICGHMGCGRYQGGHAHDHFLQTNHTFAMQVGTHRVWDYVGDNFVHRLAQNKGDGKLVEVTAGGNARALTEGASMDRPPSVMEGGGGMGGGRGGRGGARNEGREFTPDGSCRGGKMESDLDVEAKVDSVQLEYLYRFTSQLEEQRKYFEERLLLLDSEHQKEARRFQQSDRFLRML